MLNPKPVSPAGSYNARMRRTSRGTLMFPLSSNLLQVLICGLCGVPLRGVGVPDAVCMAGDVIECVILTLPC